MTKERKVIKDGYSYLLWDVGMGFRTVSRAIHVTARFIYTYINPVQNLGPKRQRLSNYSEIHLKKTNTKLDGVG